MGCASLLLLFLFHEGIIDHPLYALSLTIEQDVLGSKERIDIVSDPEFDKHTIIIRTPPNPFAIKVVLKNTRKTPVTLKFRGDPKSAIDFCVRKNGRTVSEKRFGDAYGGFRSIDHVETVTIPAAGKHVFPVSMDSVIAKKQSGPGEYQVMGFFAYKDSEIRSNSLRIVIPPAK